jgi:alpha-galactosidase
VRRSCRRAAAYSWQRSCRGSCFWSRSCRGASYCSPGLAAAAAARAWLAAHCSHCSPLGTAHSTAVLCCGCGGGALALAWPLLGPWAGGRARRSALPCQSVSSCCPRAHGMPAQYTRLRYARPLALQLAVVGCSGLAAAHGSSISAAGTAVAGAAGDHHPPLATTPMMGWNPYNHYGCGGTDARLRVQASALLRLGLHKAGFRYIDVDCGWAARNRTAGGNIAADPNKFPHGIKPLADWLHAQGLLVGIYTDIGTVTCGGGAGILGHEVRDAKDYAQWGVDLVKNDDCHHAANTTAAYIATWEALAASGRPMVHMTKSSLDIRVAAQYAQARRVSKDITWLFTRVMSLVYQQHSQGLANRSGIQASGSGFWNDMDMMEIGNAGVGPGEGIWQNLSVAESRTHFALWSLLKSPMLLGCDLTVQTPEVIEILSNEEATSLNQDKLGIQATLRSSVRVSSPERYMVMGQCNASDPQQLGWSIIESDDESGSTMIRAGRGMCVSTLWPMFEAALFPCNTSDARQRWVYNVSTGTLVTWQAFAEQPTCLMTSFAHAMRGSSVSVAICRSNGPSWAVTKDGQLSSAGATPGPLAAPPPPPPPRTLVHLLSSAGATPHPLAAPPPPPPPHEHADKKKKKKKKKPASCVVRRDSTPIETALGIGQLQVYAGRVVGGFGVALVNTDTISPHPITVRWAELGLQPTQLMQVRDIYQRMDVGNVSGQFTAVVPPHDTALLRLTSTMMS